MKHFPSLCIFLFYSSYYFFPLEKWHKLLWGGGGELDDAHFVNWLLLMASIATRVKWLKIMSFPVRFPLWWWREGNCCAGMVWGREGSNYGNKVWSEKKCAQRRGGERGGLKRCKYNESKWYVDEWVGGEYHSLFVGLSSIY